MNQEELIKEAMLAGMIAARLRAPNVGRDYQYSSNAIEQAAYVRAYDKMARIVLRGAGAST